MLFHGSLSLVAAHDIAGLPSRYCVSQERDIIGQPSIETVAVALSASFVADDRCRADHTGDVILAYWVAKVSTSPGNEGCTQPRHGILIKHAYADTNRRSSAPTVARSASR
jgi:hypothetical protein